ncbi:MAG TPA: PilZ domain-containing protein [Pyrinomonadaceae bacterium]|nr:PilZ domain-containing protein [Pyrinomonadaceae bacterium]
MYKFIVSCYYWPAGERPLRLRALSIAVDEIGNRLEYFPISKLTRLDHLTSSIERREMRRLKVKCEVELLADLSLLDTDAGEPLESLIFMGQTSDLSAAGIAMIIPSTIIDERFCDGDNRLNLSLHLPEGVIRLEVTPVRCERITGVNSSQGYLLGTKITDVTQRERFEQYIERMSDPQRAH